MGINRYLSLMRRSAQLRSSNAAGCPSVFTKDGMWNAMEQRQEQVQPQNYGLEKRFGNIDADVGPAPNRLPRKRCWLMKRTDFFLREK
ncbi:hypothetical protein KR054_006860 [Drosophila jambulina]|nr:hypothetical protein KR054_006860 [Drosophila jambulina]